MQNIFYQSRHFYKNEIRSSAKIVGDFTHGKTKDDLNCTKTAKCNCHLKSFWFYFGQ
jgi:hypothetical protein